MEFGEGSALDASGQDKPRNKKGGKMSIQGSPILQKTARDSELVSMDTTLKDPFERS